MLTEYLKALREEYLEEKVKVIILVDLNNFFDGESIYKVERGTEVEVPLWMAEEMISKGIAKFSREESVEVFAKELRKYVYIESNAKKPYPVKLPEKFYQRLIVVKRTVEKQIAELMKDQNAELIAEYVTLKKNIENYAKELMKYRMLKTVKFMIGMSEMPKEVLENLQLEEVALIENMKRLFDEWMRTIVG